MRCSQFRRVGREGALYSHGVIETNFAGVPADELSQMVAGNVITFFHLESSPA